MKINKNFLLLFALSVYSLIGIYLSLTNGISHDEFHEQLNWEINSSAVLNFFSGGNMEKLLSYNDKYHGIGFHLISQPIQFLIHKIISSYNSVSLYGGYLISKHSVIFLFFSFSSIFFYLLCLKISKNVNFSLLSTSIYLLYPYFFGHAQINPKDMPFLSFWVINSFFLLKLIENLFFEKEIKNKEIIILSFLTAFLISIRISGLLIFIQYFVGIIILFNVKKINILNFIKRNYKIILLYFFSISFFIYVLNPILWQNPAEFFKSIIWMGKYYNDICTNTLGNCLRSLNLPSSYIFIWLFFKLPILILAGLFLFPLVEEKIFKEKVISIYYGTFLFSTLAILLIFILKNVALYDEIRHIMFLVPLIFIISLTNIFYFNKKFFYISTIFSILFFGLENYSINPYQYTWLNSFAKTTDIQKNFEIDYWGISNKKLQHKIIQHSKEKFIDKNTCVYGDLYVSEFLVQDNFKCFKNYSELDAAKVRPFYAYKNVKNVKRSNPKDCKMIWNETYKYSFSKKAISVGTLWFCN